MPQLPKGIPVTSLIQLVCRLHCAPSRWKSRAAPLRYSRSMLIIAACQSAHPTTLSRINFVTCARLLHIPEGTTVSFAHNKSPDSRMRTPRTSLDEQSSALPAGQYMLWKTALLHPTSWGTFNMVRHMHCTYCFECAGYHERLRDLPVALCW